LKRGVSNLIGGKAASRETVSPSGLMWWRAGRPGIKRVLGRLACTYPWRLRRRLNGGRPTAATTLCQQEKTKRETRGASP